MGEKFKAFWSHICGADFCSAEGGGYEAAAQMKADAKYLYENNEKHNSYICSAFSLQMVDDCAICSKVPADINEIPTDAVNCIGHEDTAMIVGGILSREMHANRTSVHLNPGDEAFVFQVTGGRLPEGATTIPEGMGLKLFRVLVR